MNREPSEAPPSISNYRNNAAVSTIDHRLVSSTLYEEFARYLIDYLARGFSTLRPLPPFTPLAHCTPI
jgi:hypothetical protein